MYRRAVGGVILFTVSDISRFADACAGFEREFERICLVVNDLPSGSAESKGAVPVRRGPPSECARAHLAPDKGYNTHSTLLCTPQPWRSPPSRRFWLGQFVALASILSRCHVCGSEVVLSPVGVLSCRAFPFVTRDGAGARRMFQDVGVVVSSARRLASLHVGFPVHVWRCRRPSTSGAAAALPRVGVGPAAPRDLRRDRGYHASRGALLH